MCVRSVRFSASPPLSCVCCLSLGFVVCLASAEDYPRDAVKGGPNGACFASPQAAADCPCACDDTARAGRAQCFVLQRSYLASFNGEEATSSVSEVTPCTSAPTPAPTYAPTPSPTPTKCFTLEIAGGTPSFQIDMASCKAACAANADCTTIMFQPCVGD